MINKIYNKRIAQYFIATFRDTPFEYSPKKYFRKTFFEKLYPDHSCNDDSLQFFISFKRDDYVKFLTSVYDCCDGKKEFVDYVKKKECINYKNIIFFILNLYMFLIIDFQGRKSGIKLTFKQLLFIYLDLIILYSMGENFAKSLKCRAMVVLCDAWYMEAAIIASMNRRKVTTVSLQHAIFKEKGNLTVKDDLNYNGLIVKYMLTWGDVTKKMIEENNRCTTINCGSPLLHEEECDFTKGVIGIVFDGISYKDYNMRILKLILKLAQKYSLKIKIRKHPNDNFDNYYFKDDSVKWDSNLDDCEIIIGHLSTMLVEYMFKNKKVLCYKEDQTILDFSEEIIFENYEDLEEKFNCNETHDYNYEKSKFVAYCDQQSRTQYRKFFNGL